ncbi:MAG: hypothetical protein ACHQ0Y_05980 [Thermodesulfovibrionales bacterium]
MKQKGLTSGDTVPGPAPEHIIAEDRKFASCLRQRKQIPLFVTMIFNVVS